MSIIYFSNIRCSFPSLASPYVSKKFPTAKPTFRLDIVDLDPKSVEVQKFMSTWAAMAQATWKEHAPTIMQMINNDKRARCFGMGPEKINETTFKPLDGYGQGLWISAKSETRPQIMRADGTPADNEMEALDLTRKIYGGCRVNVAIKPWVRTANKGVSCDLVAVQFAADDIPFGNEKVDASGMFGAVAAAPAAAPAMPQMPGLPSFLQQ